MGGVFSTIFGGDDAPPQTQYQSASPEEQSRLKDVENQLQELYGNASSGAGDLQSLFQSHLQNFINGGTQAVPDAGQQNLARDFVDATFTSPTQQAINDYNSQFESGQQAKAALMGRNPNLDQSTNLAIYNSGLKNATSLAAERGSRIAQTAQGLNELNFNREAQGLGFINDLNQKAMANRLALLNARTGIGQMQQQDRLQHFYANPEHDAGLLGKISNAGAQSQQTVQNLGNAGANIGSAFGALGTIGL
jgi:hypothetical protein